jgi:hypothetical protein
MGIGAAIRAALLGENGKARFSKEWIWVSLAVGVLLLSSNWISKLLFPNSQSAAWQTVLVDVFLYVGAAWALLADRPRKAVAIPLLSFTVFMLIKILREVDLANFPLLSSTLHTSWVGLIKILAALVFVVSAAMVFNSEHKRVRSQRGS